MYIRSFEGRECMAGVLDHLPAPMLRIFCDNNDLSRIGELDSFLIDIGKVKSTISKVATRQPSWIGYLPIYHDKYGAWNSKREPSNVGQKVIMYKMYSNLTNFLFGVNNAITTSYRRLWVGAFRVEYSLQDGWVRINVTLDPTNSEYRILMGGSPPALGASLSHLATLLDVSVFKV